MPLELAIGVRHSGMARARTDRSRPGIALLSALVAVGLLASGCGSDDATMAATPGSTGSSRAPASAPPAGTSPGTAPGSTVAPTIPPPSSTSVPPPTPAPTTSPPPPPASTRGLPLASTTLRLVDTSRPTVSRGRTIAATRTLTTSVWFPTTGGPYPLIVFAHGFELGPSSYARIIQAIASAGYVVAAPSFPLADAAVAGANLDRGDIPNESGDLSFVINQILGSVDTQLRGRVDGSRIGAVGHSDGADAVLDLGYYPGRMDGRVRAVAALSPDAMTGPGGSVGSAPLLITHGDRDTITPYQESVTVFRQVRARRFLVTLVGGDHLGAVTGAPPWTAVLDRAVIDLFDHAVASRTTSDAAVPTGAAVAGVASVQQAG